MQKPNENQKLPEDRPLECGACKKPVAVRYTEVVANQITHTVMCADCPQLEQRLHGIPSRDSTEKQGALGLCCGNCGTTLSSVRMGGLLGCSVCFEVFGTVLLKELEDMHKISPRLGSQKKGVPTHIGRNPGEVKELHPSARLLALNDALNETLEREDYEQAAWIRDQINEITEMDNEQ